MNFTQLNAAAAEANCRADAIFAEIRAASPIEADGSRPIVPEGWEAKAGEARDLRRAAERFGAEAAKLAIESGAVPASVPPARVMGTSPAGNRHTSPCPSQV